MPQTTVLAFLAPGQGSQTPGMLAEWLELPGAAERIAAWSEISGLDLARLGTTATAEEITDTAVTQPLVVAATLLAYEELIKRDVLARFRADGDRRGRTLGRRDRRLRHRRRHLRRRGRLPGGDPRRRDGQGLRARAHRHVGAARRRRGRGARPARSPRPGSRQPQRGRTDRRRRGGVGAGEARRGPPGEGPGPSARHRGCVPHPVHGIGTRGVRPSPVARTVRNLLAVPSPPSRCCRTPTASRCPRPPTR